MAKEKILIIEDEKNILKNIVTLLEEEDYTVLPAGNGALGLELAKSEIPDLILCDILMPGIDGYAVLSELQKNKNTRSIPFIFVTAKVERDDLRRGMQLGADDYIFKPFSPEELLAAIETRLEKKYTLVADIDEQKSSIKKNHKIGMDGKLFLKDHGTSKFIKINEIIYISAERQYSSLKLTNGKSVLLKKSVNLWEELLPASNFLRIHRSTLINTDFITKIEKWHNSSYLIYLRDIKEHFNISKRYAAKLRQTFLTGM